MGNNLTDLLNELFPNIISNKQSECWIGKEKAINPSDLQMLHDAIEIVQKHEQLKKLKKRMVQEHPVNKTHKEQYDERLRDCITEACAFAWACEKKLGMPVFDYSKGAPDVHIPPDCWIEAKAIHRSDQSKMDMKKMLNGQIICKNITDDMENTNVSRLLYILQNAYDNSHKKFLRVNSTKSLVFFNIHEIGEGIPPIADDMKKDIINWAQKKRKATPEIELVICERYQWNNPFYYSIS